VLANASFDYATLRVVPRVEREEFVNAGIILFCLERRYLRCHIALDEERALALAPSLDLATIRHHLHAVELVCNGDPAGGPMAKLSQRERFHWLTAPRSTMLQTSPVRTGVCSKENGDCHDLDSRLSEIATTMLGTQ
jgi:hypothetical protein